MTPPTQPPDPKLQNLSRSWEKMDEKISTVGGQGGLVR